MSCLGFLAELVMAEHDYRARKASERRIKDGELSEAMAGFRVKYTLAAKLVNELVEAADEKGLTKTIARYGRVDLYTSMSWAIWSLIGMEPNCCSRFWPREETAAGVLPPLLRRHPRCQLGHRHPLRLDDD